MPTSVQYCIVCTMSDKNNRVVSLVEMAERKMLPWLISSDRRTYKKTVEREIVAKNILAPTVMGKGNATRYYISVANINKLNAAVEKGYTF